MCNIGFEKKDTLVWHMKRVHERAYVQKCKICGKELSSTFTFKEHCRIAHTNTETPKVKCDVCGTMLKNKESLRKHMQKHKQASEIHICNICGKESPNKDALLKHKKNMHWNKDYRMKKKALSRKAI